MRQFSDTSNIFNALLLITMINTGESQRARLPFRIIMPNLRQYDTVINKAKSLSRRFLGGLPGFADIKTLKVDTNSPQEILDMFCKDILPNRVNTLLHLDLKDDRTAVISTNYIMNIAEQFGYPFLSWDPDYAGALENQKDSRVLQMAPTIYHQSEALLTLLSRYNWTHFVIVTTTDSNYFDFISSINELVKRNNEHTGYPKKLSFKILKTIKFEIVNAEDDDQTKIRMKNFLKAKTPKDNRIFLLHSSAKTSKNLLEAATELGFTSSKYMWILTASSIGVISSRTRLPVGLLGVTFRGEYRSTDQEDSITTVVKDSLRVWAQSMKNLKAAFSNPNFQKHPSFLCNDTSNNASFWYDGGAIYNQMKNLRFVDRNSIVEFSDTGSNKYVTLQLVNVMQSTTSYGSKIQAWKKVGRYLPQVTGFRGNVSSVLEMDDITWPGNVPFPPKGKPERRHFHIATLEEEPYVMYRDPDQNSRKCNIPAVPCRLVYNATLHGNDSSLQNGTVSRCCSGLSIDLLRLLSEKMAFDYDLVEVPDKSFGIENERTGEWNGLIRMLQDKKTDMVLTSLQITPKRSQLVDFSIPYLGTGLAIVVSFRKGAISATAVLEPYDYPAWCLILVFSVHSMGASIFIFEWLSPRGLDKGKTPLREHQFSLFRSFWLIWAMLFGASVSTDNPRGVSSKFLANIWALFALVFLASYTANLAAFMITKEVYYKLSGITDWRLVNPLSHKPPFQFATVPNGSTQENLMENNRAMFEYMKAYNQPNVRTAMQALKKEEIQAFIYDASPLYYQVGIDKDCQLKIVGNWYARTGYSVGFPKGSDELIEEVNSLLLELREDGELERLERFWLAGACHSKRKSGQSSHDLGILNFTSAFILLASGIVLGGFLLIVEHLYFRFGRKCLRKYDKCGCCALVSLSMGKSLTFKQTIMEAIDFRNKHRCKDPLCETQLWKVKHELDLALLKIDQLKKEKVIRSESLNRTRSEIEEKETEAKALIRQQSQPADPYKVDIKQLKRQQSEPNVTSNSATKDFNRRQSEIYDPSKSLAKSDLINNEINHRFEDEGVRRRSGLKEMENGDSIYDRSMRRSPSYTQAVSSAEETQTTTPIDDRDRRSKTPPKKRYSDGKYYSEVKTHDNGEV